MRKIALLLLVVFFSVSVAEAQRAGTKKTETEETEEPSSSSNVKPPVVPPVVPLGTGSNNNSNTRPPTRPVNTNYSPSRRRVLNRSQVRHGMYVGFRWDIGRSYGIDVTPGGATPLLNTNLVNDAGEVFVDADGNEVGSNAATNFGITTGYRFPSNWGFQFGYDHGRTVYNAINERPFPSTELGGDVSIWTLTYTTHAASFAIDKAFLGLLKKSYMYARVAGKAEWYRDRDFAVAAGTLDFRENGTGAVWENTETTGPTYIVTPELGWHLGKHMQISVLYQIPLGNIFEHRYTHYDNNVAAATDQVQISNEQFMFRLSYDLGSWKLPERKKKPRPAPTPTPQVVEPAPTPEPAPEAPPAPVVEPEPEPETPAADPEPDPEPVIVEAEPEAPHLTFNPDTVQVGDHFEIDGLVFEQSSSVLQPEAQAILDDLYNTMEAYPRLKILLEGHTSPEGSASKNRQLSEARVFEARRYLIQRGISPRRIQYEGFGESDPKYPNNTDEGRAKNRRVEVRIIRK